MKTRLRAHRLAWWLLGWLLVSSVAHAGNWLKVDAAGLSVEEQAATETLLQAAKDYLPPVWLKPGATTPRLVWRDDLPAHVHGRRTGNQLAINKALLREWLQPDSGDVSRNDAQRAAIAALIHELAHFHDRRSVRAWSRDPRLLDLAGWQKQPMRLGLRIRDNRFVDRSPDRYELSNPREFVAVNLEWFLLDREYACRRPALFQYFAAQFDWAPQARSCQGGPWFLQADSDASVEGFEQFDASRIYAVDYLLAEGNDAAMSRWGHSMLRLVICAPGRALGPACRLDLQYHRVISFRAFIGDVQISSWRGLTGRYPSRLFLLSLNQVVDEYTKTELRGLQSIPLALQVGEIAAVLERAAQLHWSYDGRYYFISNNCAVETWKLLHDAVPRLSAAPLKSITPTRLLAKLERAGIADGSILVDRAQALRLGYYFEPMNVRYQEMYDVARASLQLPHARVEAWLGAAPAERSRWLENTDLRTTAALLVLEEAASRREALLARDALKRQLIARDSGQAIASAEAVVALMANEALLVRPASLGEGGYGLPQQEMHALQARAITLGKQVKGGWRLLHQAGREALPKTQQQRLAGIETNLAALGERLRALNRAQGGMQLP